MKDSSQPVSAAQEMGVFASPGGAVAAAKLAQQGLKSAAIRQLTITALREAGEKHARELAGPAVTETGMGRAEDRFAKSVAQARGTPGVECLSLQVPTDDNGLTLVENAPWGVVASVTPSTSPAATTINNAISLIATGNSMVFAPHPAAKKVSQCAITLLNQVVVAAGGPANLLVTVANPDIETAQRLFKYSGIGLPVVTGGEAVVDVARKHINRRLIAAGVGNPPVMVDETADLARAAQPIVKGVSSDNNITCADEKVLIVVDSVADELIRLMESQYAVELIAAQAEQLQPVLLKNIDERGKGIASRDWVGRGAGKIAMAIGLNVPEQTRLLFVETSATYPFAVTELMMPVPPVVRVANVDEAIELVVKPEGGCHHTATMHSCNIEDMNRTANAIDISIFVKNGPCITGLRLSGEGWTTMTITTPTEEGATSARTFACLRRCVLVDAFRIVQRANEMAHDERRWLTPRLLKVAMLCNQMPAKSDSLLWSGIDLGVCDVVLMVVDSGGQPVAVYLDWADVVRDSIVWDFFGAVTIVRRHLDTFEQQLGCRSTYAVTSLPPGTDPRVSIDVLESAGLEVGHGLDEPAAVVDLLQLDNAGVVDIGGGTTGIAIAKQGKVTYFVDEATGGHHIPLTLAENRHIQLEGTEQYKRSNGKEIWPVVKPVYEKMAEIVAHHTAGQGAADLWLVGGSCMQSGVDELFRKRFPELQVYLPQYSLFMTPLAVVDSGKEKAEGIYVS